jgi:hypothetical protein
MQTIQAGALAELAHTNAKARLGDGPIETFTAFSKATGSPVVVDVRTFDDLTMTTDELEAKTAAAANAKVVAAEALTHAKALAVEAAAQAKALAEAADAAEAKAKALTEA